MFEPTGNLEKDMVTVKNLLTASQSKQETARFMLVFLDKYGVEGINKLAQFVKD